MACGVPFGFFESSSVWLFDYCGGHKLRTEYLMWTEHDDRATVICEMFTTELTSFMFFCGCSKAGSTSRLFDDQKGCGACQLSEGLKTLGTVCKCVLTMCSRLNKILSSAVFSQISQA